MLTYGAMPKAPILSQSLSHTFFDRVQQSGAQTAQMQKVGGSWRSYTWNDYKTKVREYASVLLQAGIQRGAKVAILSNSRPEWAWADIAALSLGAVTVPVYPSLLADDVAYILKDADVSVAFVEDESQKSKLESVLSQLRSDLKVFVIKDAPESEAESIQNLSSVLTKVDLVDEEKWQTNYQDLTKSDLASIVYTSGTSGVPKGVLLTHGNFLSIIANVQKVLKMDDSDTTLLFLPMAHILGRVEHMLGLGVGWTNAYAENLKVVMDNLVEVRPTVMVSVPRIYEKIYTMLIAKVSRMTGISKSLAQSAVKFAEVYSSKKEQGGSISLADRLQYSIYNRILYEKVNSRFGGRLKYCISGGAPFSVEISRFFHSCGVLILEGYGLTETTGPLSVNAPESFKIGTVGKVFEDLDIKINDDGEIALRGDVVMSGYHEKVDETAEVFDQDKFFLTGDIGTLDSEGYLKITDRKKDIIVTAGGKNIAPQKVEAVLLQDPLLSQAIVLGDKQKYLGALVSVNAADAKRVAKEAGLDDTVSLDELLSSDAFKRLVMKRVQVQNRLLASFEAIKKIEILPRELTVEDGELTPSMKVKRRHCADKYASLVERLF